jgi:hypothetical protein
MSKKIPVRERKAITVYPDVELARKIEKVAGAENRSLGNVCAEIIRRWFDEAPMASLNKVTQALVDVFGEASEEQVKSVFEKLRRKP